MPDSPKPDITAYIGLIKAELSEHCLKLMKRMDSCYEIEKVEITAHADKEIERVTTSVRANFVDLEKGMTTVEKMIEFARPKDDKFERIADQLENLSSMIDGLTTEFFKYRMDLKDK